MPSVSVCFPAYNEQATIESVLTEAHDLLQVVSTVAELMSVLATERGAAFLGRGRDCDWKGWACRECPRSHWSSRGV